MDSSEREMNPVKMTIINPRKEYWASWGLIECGENGKISLIDRVVNIVRKVENAGNQKLCHQVIS